MARRLITVLALLLPTVVVPVLAPVPAHASARVSVGNDRGSALVDPTYATTLRVRGTSFQSIRGGHGGIYVWFGTVSPGWQPSRGGVSGQDYAYVPDSEARANAGHQRFVAFPGSDTASSANGGSMSASGEWSVDLVVPGAVFEAVGRNGAVRRVDCRTVTCGVITVGAHGVKNARNETFTPVRVGQVYDQQPAPGGSPGAGGTATEAAVPDAPAAGAPASGPGPKARRRTAASAPVLEVDRASARAGNVLAFTAAGLPAGRQVTVVLDDGRAASGPFLVGEDGGIAGVVAVPGDADPGTHELRVFGVEDPPSVRFALVAGEALQAGGSAGPAATATTPVAVDGGADRAAVAFAAVSAAVLLLALGRLVWQVRRGRRATA